MDKNIKRNSTIIIIILGLLTAIGPLSIDMYLPAFPRVASDLDTSLSKVILSLSVFFVGISIGQLICGPLLERFGRKLPLYAGLTLYFLTTIGCYFVQSVDMLILLRFFQAVGGCVGIVASRALVRDLFEIGKNAYVFSMLLLVMSISPIIAPAIGGHITSIWGWRYIFVLLFVITLLIFIGVFFFLPEGKKPDPAISLRPSFIFQTYLQIWKNHQFRINTLTSSISYASLFAYIALAPAIFMKHFGLSESMFGWIISIVAGGVVLTSQINNRLLKRHSTVYVLKSAVYAQMITGLLFVVSSLMDIENLYIVVFFAFSTLSCLGFIFPNATALALAPMEKNAGNASALLGTIQMVFGAGISALISIFNQQSVMLLAGALCFCTVISFVVFITQKKSKTI
ncbi:multidrug effflux MFS transporter [Elizabethkingia anophelis]|uniref:multidrug effflux MFS transporter n=1 Tax=Elizabethkingia anophelis TaxID=1117645 RepID=UPI00378707C5